MPLQQCSPPHILIDGTPLRRDSKGVGRYTYHICAQLDERLPPDWQMTIVTFDWELPTFPNCFRGTFIQIPYKSDLELGLRYFPGLIRALRPTVFVRPRESIGLNYPLPTVTICHDLNELIWPYQPPRSLARRIFDYLCQQLRIYALRQSDLVICNSEFVRDQAAKHYRIAPGKIQIGYCGVDPRFYELAPQVPLQQVQKRYGGQGFLLTFATGDYRENFTILPALLAHLKHLGYPGALVIAGVKEQAGYAKALIADLTNLNLKRDQDYFIEPFLGEDRFVDLVSLYTAVDFYLELSLHEGFGMQLAEAMACGTTCISSGRGALDEIGGQWVIKVDSTSPEATADAVYRAWQSKRHLAENFTQVEYIQTAFSWKQVGKHLVDFTSNTTKLK
jgi:glycosyltransferase involved in cell wall biosynthesis